MVSLLSLLTQPGLKPITTFTLVLPYTLLPPLSYDETTKG